MRWRTSYLRMRLRRKLRQRSTIILSAITEQSSSGTITGPPLMTNSSIRSLPPHPLVVGYAPDPIFFLSCSIF